MKKFIFFRNDRLGDFLILTSIIKSIKDTFKIPVFGYQVSGEYAMIKNSINRGNLGDDVILESLMSIKRSGASAIVTYFALEIAKKLKNFS